MRTAAAFLSVLVLALAGCGGDDDESTSTTPTETGASGASGESGAVASTVTIDDVESCLTDAGFEPSVSDSQLIGLESMYEQLDVPLEDLDTAGKIVVFESAEAAEAEAEAAQVAMGTGDTVVAGNTIWGVDFAVDEPEDLEAAIEGCVPS